MSSENKRKGKYKQYRNLDDIAPGSLLSFRDIEERYGIPYRTLADWAQRKRLVTISDNNMTTGQLLINALTRR